MWSTAKKALEHLQNPPRDLQTLVDDGMEREGGVYLAFKDRVLLIGGWAYGLGAVPKGMRSDVWEVQDMSALGESKSQLGHYRVYQMLKEHCGFPPRSDHACCAASDGTLYLTGGRLHPSRIDGTLNDMWKSQDGLNWELVCEQCPWTARYSHTMVACPSATGDILLVAGQGEHIEGGWESFNDVWRYLKAQDEWRLITTSAEWCKRAAPTVRSGLDGELVLCGGEVIYPEVSPAGFSQLEEPTLNDVWRSRDAGETWQCACEEAPFPPARRQWLEYLSRTQEYIVFGQREGRGRSSSCVYTSKDLAVWTPLHSGALESKTDAMGRASELRHVFCKEDGTIVFLTQLLT